MKFNAVVDSVDKRLETRNIESIYKSPLQHEENKKHQGVVVFYNRVPKTGSTSFTNLLYDISRDGRKDEDKEGKMYVMQVTTLRATNRSRLSLRDQRSFVQNVTTWLDHRPAFIHGHYAYISFQQFGANDPLYINPETVYEL